MGLFNKLFNKKKEVEFEVVKEKVLSLSNQNGSINNPTRQDLNHYLNCLFDEDDQFITLTLDKAENKVRFVQACFAGTDLIVQLGLEENSKTKLVEKTCASQECVDIFYNFFDEGIVEHLEEYKPVQF